MMDNSALPIWIAAPVALLILVGAGLTLVGSIGLLQVVFWPARERVFGEHALRIGVTVAVSLVWIVVWGSIAGSMLPFALRRAGLDPASASAPFVATLVDVTGLVIYFSVATVILSGTVL